MAGSWGASPGIRASFAGFERSLKVCAPPIHPPSHRHFPFPKKGVEKLDTGSGLFPPRNWAVREEGWKINQRPPVGSKYPRPPPLPRHPSSVVPFFAQLDSKLSWPCVCVFFFPVRCRNFNFVCSNTTVQCFRSDSLSSSLRLVRGLFRENHTLVR